MRIPLKQMTDLGRYIQHKKRAREKYFPLVLMLEPLHACNLACIGCGRIVEYKDTIRDQMPLKYKHIVPLTSGLLGQKRHVMICTNALLLERFVKHVPPSPYLSFNIHLD